MAKYGKKTMSKGKKALLILGVIVLLIGLFFLSFWITTLSLRSNQDPGIAPASGSPAASATPAVDYNKLSKKELIALVEEKDEKIRQLEESLASGQTNTQAPIASARPSQAPSTSSSGSSSSASSGSASTPRATTKPAAKTATPTRAPTPKPKPVVTPAPTPEPPQPTQPPATQPPATIRPVAPAADAE